MFFQMKELEDEFSKLPGDPPVPTRLLRSQQEATPNEVSVTTTESSVGMYIITCINDSLLILIGAVVTMVPEPIDPYELFEPVDMISKMPKDFYEKMVSCLYLPFHLSIYVISIYLSRRIPSGKRGRKLWSQYFLFLNLQNWKAEIMENL